MNELTASAPKLQRGDRLGAYEVVDALGSGGMGEVYRARDTKLRREVALKVLPPSVANDPDRLHRFEREAHLLAALNHPHIAAIYGFEESTGITALVLELVEGQTLAERIAVGRVPVEEALAIARQIAEALEVAHERGITHRDLKPANVKLTPDGTVKVLDFGLAKMEVTAANLADSPTFTGIVTREGVIAGTAPYMSPEQARGKQVDKRADIWAFGCVLYELLTAARAFPGETTTDVLAAVVNREPDFSALPPATPPSIRRLLARCLDKDPKRRLRDIGEARVEIEDLLSGASEEVGGLAIPPVRSLWPRTLPWASTGALAVGLMLVLALWVPWRAASPVMPLRLSSQLGADVSLTFGFGDALSLSPDGAVVAFVAQKSGGGSSQLYVRRLTQLQATPLSGTDDAASPFFSPDGEWIAFFAGGKLKKIAATGGAAANVCDAPDGRGGAWSEDGTIVFQRSAMGGGLMRVSSAGGTPEVLTLVAEDQFTHMWPQVLPGGKAVLFTSGGIGNYNAANLVVQSLATGARTVVQTGGYHGRYLPSGHLVFLRDGTLFAAPLDLDRLDVPGQRVPAIDAVMSNANSGSAQFAVSASGTMVYLSGQSVSGVPIHWMNREGSTTPLRATPANWANLMFAPDGRRLALQMSSEGQLDIWIYEWTRDTLTRLTIHAANESKPVWTPDGRRIVFASNRADKSTPNLYWQRADGAGDTQRLAESKHRQQPASWHPSGKFLAFEEVNPASNSDLMILPMEGDEASGWKPGQPTVFLNGPAQEREPTFSPDGRWLAYVSNESGRDEVYVRPFVAAGEAPSAAATPGGKWLISTGGGSVPTWSRTKRELFYSLNGQIMVASFAVLGDSFRAENPRIWSAGRFVVRGLIRMFDLHPDGERVALAPVEQAPSAAKHDHVTFIFNFFDELRRIAPAASK